MEPIVPVPFPNAAYFLQMLDKTGVGVCDSIRWERQDVFNRYTILTDKGPHRLTIPVEKPAQEAQLKEVRISYREPWLQQHLRAIVSAYKGSPFFEFFEADLAALFAEKPEYLVDFSLKSLTFCLISLKNLRPEAARAFFAPSGEDCWQKIDIITLRKQLGKPLKPSLAYRQVFGKEFVDTISILDALFCAGPRGLFIPDAGS